MKNLVLLLLFSLAAQVTNAQQTVAVVVAEVSLTPTKQEQKKFPAQYWVDQASLEATMAQEKLIALLGDSILLEGKRVAVMPAETVQSKLAAGEISTMDFGGKKPAELCKVLDCDFLIICFLSRYEVIDARVSYQPGGGSAIRKSKSYDVNQDTRLHKSDGTLIFKVNWVSNTEQKAGSGTKSPDIDYLYSSWAKMTSIRLNKRLNQ